MKKRYRLIGSLILLALLGGNAFWNMSRSTAHTNSPTVSDDATRNPLVTINQKARAARNGNEIATRELVEEMFRTFDFAQELGELDDSIKDRLIRAELQHSKKRGKNSCSEQRVVHAVNQLADRIGCCAFFASCSGGNNQVQSGFRVLVKNTCRSLNIVAGTPGLECIGYLTPNERDVTLNSLQTSKCLTFGIVFPFTAAPNLIDLQAPPATVEMWGENLTTTYGMPYIEYRDPYTGNLIGATSATSVSEKGSVLYAPPPDLSSVFDGVYNVLISNIRADGSFEPVGSSTIECTGRPWNYEPPPDPGPCGCPPDLPCMPCILQ